jgi:hypothetical protein
MSLPALPNLHDGVLERVTVDWSRRLVRILATAVPGGLLMIVAEGLREIRIPRRDPWRPSDFINHASVEQGNDSAVIITIEMQSGDHITLACENFRITHPGTD